MQRFTRRRRANRNSPGHRESARLNVEQLESRKLLAGVPLGMLVEWNDASSFAARGGFVGRGGYEALESREVVPQVYILLASGRNQDGPRAGGGELIVLPPSSAATMFLWAMARELRFDSPTTSGGSLSGGPGAGGPSSGGPLSGGSTTGSGGINHQDSPNSRPFDPNQGEGEAPEDLPKPGSGRGPSDSPATTPFPGDSTGLPGANSGAGSNGGSSSSLGGSNGSGGPIGTGSGSVSSGIGTGVGGDRGGSGTSDLGADARPSLNPDRSFAATSFFAADVDSIWSGLGSSAADSHAVTTERATGSLVDSSGFARSSVVTRELRQVAADRGTTEADEEGEISESKRDGQEVRGVDTQRGKAASRRWASRGTGASQRTFARDSFVMDTLVDDAIESLLMRLRDVTPVTEAAAAESAPETSGSGGYVELETDAPADEAATDRADSREARVASAEEVR